VQSKPNHQLFRRDVCSHYLNWQLLILPVLNGHVLALSLISHLSIDKKAILKMKD
jgi:hypothetical protein